MTSWRTPDYQIKIILNEENNCPFIESLSGTFSIKLKSQNRSRLISGMLMISSPDAQEKQNSEMWGLLWIDSKKTIIPLEEQVSITLLEECNPMFQLGNEKDYLKKILPITLEAMIYEIKSASSDIAIALACLKG